MGCGLRCCMRAGVHLQRRIVICLSPCLMLRTCVRRDQAALKSARVFPAWNAACRSSPLRTSTASGARVARTRVTSSSSHRSPIGSTWLSERATERRTHPRPAAAGATAAPAAAASRMVHRVQRLDKLAAVAVVGVAAGAQGFRRRCAHGGQKLCRVLQRTCWSAA